MSNHCLSFSSTITGANGSMSLEIVDHIFDAGSHLLHWCGSDPDILCCRSNSNPFLTSTEHNVLIHQNYQYLKCWRYKHLRDTPVKKYLSNKYVKTHWITAVSIRSLARNHLPKSDSLDRPSHRHHYRLPHLRYRTFVS